jgi:hypothetical protein
MVGCRSAHDPAPDDHRLGRVAHERVSSPGPGGRPD